MNRDKKKGKENTVRVSSMQARAYYRRLKLGYTVEQAHFMPKHQPRWQWFIEQEEGKPIWEVVKDQKRYGVGSVEIARGFGVHRNTLRRWIRKWEREGKL